MEDILKTYKDPLRTIEDVLERVKYSDIIRNELTLIDSQGWNKLYVNDFDGTYWIEEYFPPTSLADISCFFMVNGDDPKAVFNSLNLVPGAIVEKHEKLRFWNDISDEEGNQVCRTSECMKHNIKNSVYCKKHHYESIQKENCPF